MVLGGIDYSMSCPAITIYSEDWSDCRSFFYSKSKKHEGIFGGNIFGTLVIPYSNEQERFDNISHWAIKILEHFSVDRVILEGYSMGSKGRVFNIAENTGLLKHKMWKSGIAFDTPAPGAVKKCFHGKGNATKDQMHDAFVGRTGIDLAKLFDQPADSNPVSDIVDSYAMCIYGISNQEV